MRTLQIIISFVMGIVFFLFLRVSYRALSAIPQIERDLVTINQTLHQNGGKVR